MAATYWVRSSGGNDSNDGLSFAQGWATVQKVLDVINASGVKGDVYNIVNDGTHTMPTAKKTVTRAHAGTDYDSDPGFVIRGTDSSGDPALTTCASTGGTIGLLALRNGVRYVKIQGLKIDMTNVPTTSGVSVSTLRDATAGPIQFKDCHFIGYADDDVDTMKAVRSVCAWQSVINNDMGEALYCIFQNIALPFNINGPAAGQLYKIHHCVFWVKGGWVNTFNAGIKYQATAKVGSDVRVYNNTWYVEVDDAISGAIIYSPVTNPTGRFDCHSNAAWFNSSLTTTQVVFFCGLGDTATSSFTGTLGNNSLRTGPDVTEAEVPQPRGWYGEPWGTETGGGGLDPKATDSVDYEVAHGDYFSDISTPLAWTASGDGYTLTVPGDLRLITDMTVGVGGTVPGALGGASTDRSVTNVADDTTPIPDDTVVFTIVAANSGIDDTNVEVEALGPVGLTLRSHTKTTGSWVEEGVGTGVWTIGNLNDGASETLTLTYTVDSDQGGNSIDLDATISGDLSDSDAGNDVATETLNVTEVTDLSVTNAADVGIPDPGDTVTFTIVASNSGSTDSAVVVAVTGLSGMTYVSDTPTTGTYDSGTGIWTIGSMVDSASETMTLVATVDSDQSGSTLLIIATVSGALTDSDSSNNVDSATLFVANTDSVVDEDNPAAAPFIDVLPLIQPDLRLEVLVKLEMIHKRVREASVRDDFEDAVWSEFTSKRLVIATNTTEQINLGGVARGEYLMINATTAVDVSAVRGGTPLYWSGIKSLIVGRGDFEKVHIRNTSTTLTSTILIGVVD
jgi:uncharacterized repeat protein (TIGR01451 family)